MRTSLPDKKSADAQAGRESAVASGFDELQLLLAYGTKQFDSLLSRLHAQPL